LENTMRRLFLGLLLICLPIGAFVLIRLSTGGGALDVNYAQSDTGAVVQYYLSRLWRNPADVLLRTGLVFGVLWVALCAPRDATQQALWRQYVPLVMLATLALSSRITRVEGAPLAPVVIPAFLVWVEGRRYGDVVKYKE
jgi:hypothetical protein